MRIVDLNSGSSSLRDAADTLWRTWEDTQQHWNDANSRHIEEAHLRPLMKEVGDALQAVQHMAEVLNRAARECEPW